MRFCLVWLLCLPLWTQAAITVSDGSGRRITLAQPAQRIVSLAPHLTELLFAAGAGEQVVGVVSYSNWPPAARGLPEVGSYNALDLERVLALRPDLVLAWSSGNNSAQLERLEHLGLTVYRHEPHVPEDIPHMLEQIGLLAGSAVVADAAAAQWRTRLQHLRVQHAQAEPLTVFYQVWHQPLMTVSGAHLISAAIELCGGRNVFAALPVLAPQVSLEAVLAADPQVIIASGMAEERPDWLDDWKRWPQLVAVRDHNLYFIPPDLLQRAGPRFIDGAERLCAALEQARRRRR